MNEGIPVRLNSRTLAVETIGLRKRYGRTQALMGLDLTVPEGSFYLLVGPNGAGKSTTIKILLDVIRADAGIAEVFGIDTRAGAAVRAATGWVPEKHDELYTWLRVDRLLAHHASYYPTWDAAYAHRLCQALSVKVDRKLAGLSKGEARRVQLVMALAHRPPLLLLDEPTDGLDPAARDTVLVLLAEHLAESPTTVIVSTHLVHEMDGLADHMGVIRDGAIAAQLQREELERRLLSYTLDIPENWRGATQLGVTMVRQNGDRRQVRWTVWGDQGDVVQRFAVSGARVRDVTPVTLEEAAIALLMPRE